MKSVGKYHAKIFSILFQRGPMGTMGSNGSSVVSSLGKSGKSRKVGWTMPRQRSWFLLAAISKWHRRASREFFSPFFALFACTFFLSFFLSSSARQRCPSSYLSIASPVQSIFSAASSNGLSRGLIGNSFPRIFSSMKTLPASLSLSLSVSLFSSAL